MLFYAGLTSVSLGFLCLIAILFFTVKHIKNTQNIYFSFLLLENIAALCCGLILAVLLSSSLSGNSTAVMHMLVLFLICDLTLMPLLFIFPYVVSGTLDAHRRPLFLLNYLPFLVMLGLSLTNSITHMLFYFDTVWHAGPLRSLLFFYTVFYLTNTLLSAYRLRSRIKKPLSHLAIYAVSLNAVSLLLQYCFSDKLFLGISMSLTTSIIYLNFQTLDPAIDVLTDCFDRTALQQQLQNLRRRGHQYQILALSIDGFHRINNAFGVVVGDMLLRRIALFLTSNANTNNVYRVIGDRFVVLTETEGECRQLLHCIKKRFALPWRIHSYRFLVSICICSITHPDIHRIPEELSPLIDYSINRAKEQGPGTVLAVDEQLIEDFRRYTAIERYLHLAISDNLFRLDYQPIYSIRHHRYVSFEALIRLTHPIYGPISPSEFIPIAEHSGMILRISDYVLDQVCSFIASNDLESLGIQNIKINLSAIDLMQGNLEKRIIDALDRHHVNPQMLCLEITETAATFFTPVAADTFSRLHQLGVSLSLDDFGSGYANLDSVMLLPFNVVKLDRSLLLGAAANDRGRVLYQNLVHILNELNLEVVAEGVETEEQVTALHSWLVDYIQGYYYSQPLSPSSLIKMLLHSQAPSPALLPATSSAMLKSNPISIPQTIDIVNTIAQTPCFSDYCRFIELESHLSYCFSGEGLVPVNVHTRCYEKWHRSSPCVNCVCSRMFSGDLHTAKLEPLGDRVYLIQAFPYEWQGRHFALEISSDVTSSYCCTPTGSMSANTHPLTALLSQLNQMVACDNFTGLQNKGHFLNKLPALLSEFSSHPEDLSLALFDIHHFSGINETFGHLMGDVVLLTVASILRTLADGYTISASRYQDDQFLLLFQGLTKAQAKDKCEHLKYLIEEYQFEKNNITFHINVSYGLVQAQNPMTPDYLIEQAIRKTALRKGFHQ